MADIRSDQKANIRTLRRLYQDGLLHERAFIAASRMVRPTSAWFDWARRMLLFFGSALVLAGVIYFFAYNWSKMEHFLKFALIEAGILACILASYLRGIWRLSGKVLLLSGSVLVGVLLAVYGQIYQTGADAFELFIGWAVLISGWVFIAEFSALWLVWLILLNTGTILYWIQVGNPAHSIRYEFLCLAVALLNGIALAFYEVGVQQGLKWLRSRWQRGVLLAGPLFALSIPTIALIEEPGEAKGITVLVAFAWGVVAIGGYLCYRYELRDMIPLAIIISNACVILLTILGKALLHDTGGYEAGRFLLFSLIILAVVSMAVFLLRHIAAKMAGEAGRHGT
jgi:uncharacterized membrane protein